MIAWVEWEGVLARRPQMPCGRWGCWRRRRGRCYGSGCLQHPLETADVKHLGIEGEAACLLHTGLAVAAHQGKQRIHAAHPGPGQRPLEYLVSKAPDGRTVLGRLTLEETDVAHCIGALVSGEVVGVDGPAARALPRVG